MNVNWSNDLIFQLIDLYREKRPLWDHDMPENKDKLKKHQLWQEIADILNIDKETVMRKMKILSTQFQREYAKYSKVPAEEGSSRWFAYTRMLFLGGTTIPRPTPPADQRPMAAADQAVSTHGIHTYHPYQISPISEYTMEVKEEIDMSEGESFQSSASAPSVSTRRKRPAASRASPACARAAGDASPASRDEYALYGEYVALKLRNMGDAYARHKAQQQINDVLFHAEMGDLA